MVCPDLRPCPGPRGVLVFWKGGGMEDALKDLAREMEADAEGCSLWGNQFFHPWVETTPDGRWLVSIEPGHFYEEPSISVFAPEDLLRWHAAYRVWRAADEDPNAEPETERPDLADFIPAREEVGHDNDPD